MSAVAKLRGVAAPQDGAAFNGEMALFGAGRAAIKCATMRADKASCSASLNAARRATMSRRNARRQAVLSSFASCISII